MFLINLFIKIVYQNFFRWNLKYLDVVKKKLLFYKKSFYDNTVDTRILDVSLDDIRINLLGIFMA